MSGSAHFEREPALVIRGDAIVALCGLLAASLDIRKERGGIFSPLELQVVSELRTAASSMLARDSESGTDGTASQPRSEIMGTMTTTDVVRRLGVSDSYARRIASRLGGTKVGGRWLFVTDLVDEYAQARRAR